VKSFANLSYKDMFTQAVLRLSLALDAFAIFFSIFNACLVYLATDEGMKAKMRAALGSDMGR
jgi:hypothetical protein